MVDLRANEIAHKFRVPIDLEAHGIAVTRIAIRVNANMGIRLRCVWFRPERMVLIKAIIIHYCSLRWDLVGRTHRDTTLHYCL